MTQTEEGVRYLSLNVDDFVDVDKEESLGCE